MKLHILALSATVLLHLLMEIRAQFPHPPMPYPQPRSMQPMPMPSMGMPGPMPPMGIPGIPMGLPMPMMQQQRMPVVVMPYHSKTADNFIRKKRPKRRRRQRIRIRDSESTSSSDSDSDSSSSSSSSEVDFMSSKKKRHQVLTPVVSYVTKDGYVIYQKKIKKELAKDWLDMEKGAKPEPNAEKSEEMTLRQLKKKYGSRKKKRRRDKRRGD